MNRSLILAQQQLYLSYLPHVRRQFGSLPGVELIGLGAKERKGTLLEEWAFRFYVRKKLSLNEIPIEDRIPESIFGIQTDVIPHFEKETLVCNAALLSVDSAGYRDNGLRGGIGIRNEHFDNDQLSGYGTLGILARRKIDNKLVGLSCAHVVNAASGSVTDINTKIGQPKYWISCCCCPHGYIGDVAKATSTSDLDCAIITIHDDLLDKISNHTTENQVEGIGLISGAAAIMCFDTVRKRGRATGLTTGKISDMAYGTNQMLIERTDGNAGDPFACHGDSGSVIVNSSNQVVGLLVAASRGNMSRIIATHIKPVMTDLGITIAGTDVASIGEPVGGGPGGCELHAWPGGHTDTALNPVEIFESSDFGFAGAVDWDVSGGAPGAVILGTGTQTATGQSTITVRYDRTSASKNPTDTVWIKAIQGSEETTKFRTIFTINPRFVNTSSLILSNNTNNFAATGGNNRQAGVAIPGTDGATWYLAKTEIVYDISPSDLIWSGSGGVSFVTGAPAGTEGNIVSRRESKFTKGEQAAGATNRTHTDQPGWASAGDSTADDFQGPTDTAPNELFRLANEGFDPSNLIQGYLRADYRDYLEFFNGLLWDRITPYSEWFANLTADRNATGTVPPVTGAVNTIGTGATTEKIPNQKPTITVSPDQEVRPGELVTLTATPADADQDVLTPAAWTQTAGPAVALSSATGNSVTFTAPANDPQLKFSATTKDSTETLSRTLGNHLSDPAETIVNVVEWKNIGGGDPVAGRNMTEVFNAADFGIGAGPLNWDVTTGGTDAVIIERDGVPMAAAGSVAGATTIKVRYDNRSADLTRAQSVKVQAANPANGKIWFKRRTVFRVTVAVHATDTKTHLIPSNKGAAGIDHFCTAKDGGNMIFHATINPAPPAADIGWTATGRAITVPSVGGDRTTAHIDRGPASGMRIPIAVQVSGDNVYEGLSWIIWSTGSLYDRVAPFQNFTGLQTRIQGDYKFKFVLQPAGIATVANDIPDLTGANTTNVPDVPAADASVWNKGVSLSGGANRKWDVSRRLRQKMINVANIPTSLASFPTFYTTYNNLPSDLVVGNDDTHVLEAGFPEDNDPYTAPAIGEIHAFDGPSITPFYAEGDVGDTFEKRMHFQEFARVELDGHWYVISDPLLWRFHARCIKASESSDGTDYDGDGAQNKELWINNASILDGTNDGW